MGFEPVLERQVTRACAACGGADPKAHIVKGSGSFHCTCENPKLVVGKETFSAKMLGFWGWLGALKLKIGRALYRAAYSKGLDS